MKLQKKTGLLLLTLVSDSAIICSTVTGVSMITHLEGRLRGMEKRVKKIFLQACFVLMAFGYMTITANAQLLNGGFESSAAPPVPDNWTTFNGAVQSTNVAHSGLNSLKTYGPYGAGFDASGAHQEITTGISAGQTWVLDGYLLNWSGDAMTGSNGWAIAQLRFCSGGSCDTNIGGTVLQSTNTIAYGSPTGVSMPEDVWQHFLAIATVPVGADTMQVQLLHVGEAGNSGSTFFDDVNLYQQTGQVNTNAATSQPGVQLSWPASVSAITQVQTTPTLSTNTVWTNFGPVWQGTGGTNQITDVIGSATNKFYKVIQVQ